MVCELYGSAKGIEIFNSVVSVVESHGGFEKYQRVVTDGARAMTGQGIGVTGILKDHGVITAQCSSHHSSRSSMSQKFADG